jgi:phage shock protein C
MAFGGMMMKKLYRSRTNRMIFGVLGGLGEYYNIDPNVLRIGAVIAAFVTGFVPAILVYVLAYIIVPEKPSTPVV